MKIRYLALAAVTALGVSVSTAPAFAATHKHAAHATHHKTHTKKAKSSVTCAGHRPGHHHHGLHCKH